MKLLKILKYILMVWVIIHGLTTIVLSLLNLFHLSDIDIGFTNIPMFSAILGMLVYIVIDHQLKKKHTE